MDEVARANILVVAPEGEPWRAWCAFLRREGHRVAASDRLEDVAAVLHRFRPNVVVLDDATPGLSLPWLLGQIARTGRDEAVILCVGQAAVPEAPHRLLVGRTACLRKPFRPERLVSMIRDCLLRRERGDRTAPVSRERLDHFLGTSPATQALLWQAEQVAKTRYTVVVRGDSAPERYVLARGIHDMGPRRAAPFVAADCAEPGFALFGGGVCAGPGQEEAAVRGADLLSAADRGTLFLDHIGRLPTCSQFDLLHILEWHRYRPRGDERERSVGVRFLIGTDVGPADLMNQSQLVTGLYYCLSACVLSFPPLEERREDIPALCRLFLGEVSDATGRHVPVLSPEAESWIVEQPWPGGSAHLAGVLSAAAREAGGAIGMHHLRAAAGRYEEERSRASGQG